MESGISEWYVARRDIWGPVRREDRNVERCWLCALASVWRLSIMRRCSVSVSAPQMFGHMVKRRLTSDVC